jgi:hypothetical protein
MKKIITSFLCLILLLMQGCVYLHRPVKITKPNDKMLSCENLVLEFDQIEKKREKFYESNEVASNATWVVISPILVPLVILAPISIMAFSSGSLTFYYNDATPESYSCRKTQLYNLMKSKACLQFMDKKYEYIDKKCELPD